MARCLTTLDWIAAGGASESGQSVYWSALRLQRATGLTVQCSAAVWGVFSECMEVLTAPGPNTAASFLNAITISEKKKSWYSRIQPEMFICILSGSAGNIRMTELLIKSVHPPSIWSGKYTSSRLIDNDLLKKNCWNDPALCLSGLKQRTSTVWDCQSCCVCAGGLNRLFGAVTFLLRYFFMPLILEKDASAMGPLQPSCWWIHSHSLICDRLSSLTRYNQTWPENMKHTSK